MTRKVTNWKDQTGDQEIPILADLSIEHCVDELFRPYLPAETAVRQVTNPAPAVTAPSVSAASSAPKTRPEQFFAVLARSLESFWPTSTGQALVSSETASVPVRTTVSEAKSRDEHFTPVVVPKNVAVAAPPLPHAVREELLELRTEVMHAVRTERLQTLMICGVQSGAGTSFVAGQLTRILAEYAQLKIAFLTLVSSRERPAHRLTRRSPQTQVQFLLRRTELPNLAEIASANGAITLTELLCHCSTAEVLRQMKAEFDLIVIDTPAIGMYGETAVLAALMDGVILVAEPNVTPLRRMDRAHRRLHKARAKILGMVFNRQRPA
ncbi:MAG TPA: hypothetical protein VFZ34_16205 [Blastocatellia bacterium]|nr:hypothetical protein [Blastocatellia bacterium]